MSGYWVYIMTNPGHTVLYTGVTNNLPRRIAEHKEKRGSRFAARYNVTNLVYCECFSSRDDAIAAEKRIKAGSRAKKIRLISGVNPHWKDLSQ